MKKWGLTVIATVALLLSSPGVFALPTLSGSVSYPAGITASAGTDWALEARPPTLTWNVSYNSTDQMWNYMYTWSTPGKALSHIIIEVSPGAVTGDFIFAPGQLGTIDGIGTYSSTSQGNSNPGMPGPMYGMKVNPNDNTTVFTFSFETWRPPVWGDFYAKDGTQGTDHIDVYAFNSGFLDADPTSTSGDGRHIVVPDGGSTPVPEPGTMLLLGLGLIGIGIIMRELF